MLTKELIMSKKRTIEEMQEIAKQYNGKCLSDSYVNAHRKLTWQCSKEHIWEASANTISNRHWCPICAGRGNTISDMQQLAKDNRGECLSTNYINTDTRLIWKCEKGHIWEQKPAHIKAGHWCPYCSGNARLTIEDMKALAKQKNGKCLSKTYKNAFVKLKWQCEEGHIWEAKPNNIVSGGWCPLCSSGVSERICRRYFDVLFGNKFIKTKPKWLKNSKGNQMELDGYCENLKLAFEYQGAQHYIPNTRFSRGDTFLNRQKDDEIKRNLCKDHGINLIEVPYTVSKENIMEHIISECNTLGIQVQNANKDISINISDIYSPNKLKEMRSLAVERGGICLSDKYISNHNKLLWTCNKGHKWEAQPSAIKRGTWCPTCAGRPKTSIDDMIKLAKNRDGKCLSEVYVNAKTKLKWSCQYRHEWEAIPDNIKRGQWCPYCARDKHEKRRGSV